MRLSFLIILFLFYNNSEINKSKSNTSDINKIPVIFLCGQSNMEGGDSATLNTPDSFKSKFDSILMYVQGRNSIEPLQYTINNNWERPKKYFGPECPLGFYLNKYRKIAIVKFAYGGSSLVDYKYNENGHWQIDANPLNGAKQYDTLIQKFAYPAFDKLTQLGYKPYVLALCWCQGEEDSKYLYTAKRYYSELIRLFNKFKEDMKVKDSSADSMYFTITETHPFYDSKHRFIDSVRDAEQRVVEYFKPHAFLINGDNWEIISDSLHWSRQAQGFHGKAISDIILNLK